MPNENTSQSQTVLTLSVSEETMKQIKTLFHSEPDEVQYVVKQFATSNKRDSLLEYSNYIFLQFIEKQYLPKRIALVASRIPTFELMLKTGVPREKALAVLEIEEHELSAITEVQPKKGAAKRVADIKRAYGK